MTFRKIIYYSFWMSVPIILGCFLSFLLIKTSRISSNYLSEYFTTATVMDANILVHKTNIPAKEISLLFVGDIMLDRSVKESVLKNADGNFSFLFQDADFVKNADIAFGNLEGPLSDKGKNLGNLYSFRMYQIAVYSLKEAGFDVLSLANNHIGDWGKEAFEDTVSALKNEDIIPLGPELSIIEKNKIKIGFLAFSDVGPDWIRVSDKDFENIIKNASKETDILIISLHFGEEYQNKHNQRQEELGHLAIDSGAKIVIGHHPHVIQDIETYKNGIIAYSLGNFIFDQNFSEETMEGLCLEVVVSNKGEIKNITKKIIKLNKFYQPELK